MKYPQLVSMPSAVSDWLEEQLEARGIDSEVYTRYILSLLHVHTLDVIYPEDEELFTELKKSCEIESLVDELCEKLKEADAPSESSATEAGNTRKSEKTRKISPGELAQRYYAAFPPLRPGNARTDCATETSPKKGNKRKNKRHVHQNRMYSDNLKARTNQSRGRVAYKRELRPRSLNKEIFNNMTNWKFLNNNSNNKGQCLGQNLTIEDDFDMYEGLPVDISDLLNESCSPPKGGATVELMNLANAMNTAKENQFLARGTNITSSIWSNVRCSPPKSEFQFREVESNSWPKFISQNETNTVAERKSVFDGLHALPPDRAWDDSDLAAALHENECLFDMLTISFMKVNHDKECSSFAEVKECAKKPFSLFSNNARMAMAEFSGRDGLPHRHLEKDDLLTSERSHFKPIKDPVDECDYADGTTFVINGNLEKVDYGRSASGSMLFETEFGQRKFRHYHSSEDEPDRSFEVGSGLDSEFVLKYQVKQIDKACQTEGEAIVALTSSLQSPSLPTYGSERFGEEWALDRCRAAADVSWNNYSSKKSDVGVLDGVMDEVSWPYVTKSCDKCAGDDDEAWNTDWGKQLETFDTENVMNIWNGNKVCHACLKLNNTVPRDDMRQRQLRLETIRDGEQLMSDIRTIHNRNMEFSVPVLARLGAVEPPDQRKRRHSYMDNATDSWSFATRLQEDCFVRMSALPTLRSVTL
ncbi:uncharacterized protein LOC132702610 isoform X2 [Cylas formicarius]|uniref:uncharacterized protein LOC132702610 isoform X2 n=1 Tax=Cylas formicarius TaxID=197179 RepID=UPI002958517C|nr:uncharacterized protein LOC132702610 isoform X2 [Cylas formicarius]